MSVVHVPLLNLPFVCGGEGMFWEVRLPIRVEWGLFHTLQGMLAGVNTHWESSVLGFTVIVMQ